MTHRCSECGESMAVVARERAALNLPSLSETAKTCGEPECVAARRKRVAREWWAGIRDRKLERPRAGEPWRCSECGCDLATADAKRRRRGMRLIGLTNVVCSPECQKAREARRYILRHGHPPQRKRRPTPR